MNYEVKELITPQSYEVSEHNEMKNAPKLYVKLKRMYYPDAVILLRVGDFYETYCDDAEECAKLLGIILTIRNRPKSYRMAGFPHYALDSYLPKLVRAGKRVAICDQLEDPKLTKKLVKRGSSEMA